VKLSISPKVLEKLANKKPPVTKEEIKQCFANRTGNYLLDEREEHASNPPTRWFIAETDFGRELKIAFILVGHVLIIRTAYEPNADEMRIYQKYGN
jgi:hypothetical protein